jgi:hypothetical protein
MSIPEARAAEGDVRQLIAKLEAEVAARAQQLTEMLVKNQLYSGKCADAKRLQQELLDRVSVGEDMLKGLNAEDAAALLHSLEHNLQLSQQMRTGSTQPVKEACASPKAQSAPVASAPDLIELKRIIQVLPADKQDLLRAWVEGICQQNSLTTLELTTGLETVQKLLLKALKGYW